MNSQAIFLGVEIGGTMKYRELGRTGLKLSVVSYRNKLWPVGRPENSDDYEAGF